MHTIASATGAIQSASPDDSGASTSEDGHPSSRRGRQITILGYMAAALAVTLGWRFHDRWYLTAEEGTGYMLGIVGGSMLLLLLLYPLRKKIRFMRFFGSVRFWFRTHMILGVLGPILVLYHANFNLGSLNSKVATISMLVVAVSGLVGRYLYTKIHHGLYGHRVTLVELMEDAISARDDNSSITFLPRLDERLLTIEQSVLQPPNSVLRAALRPIIVAIKTRWAQLLLIRDTKRDLDSQARASRVIAEHESRLRAVANRHIANRLRKVRRVAEFTFYERVFALWHVLHFPLFIILLVAATVHILAVHMY